MKKKTALILLILTGVVGAFVNFYTTNLLFSDLSNMFYGTHDAYIIASLPGFFVSFDLTLLFIFLLRYFRYPQYHAGLTKLYPTFLLVSSALGAASAIVTGCVIYPSLSAPYPFPGYTLLSLILHALLGALAVFLLLKRRKTTFEGQEKKEIKLRYAVYSVFLFGFIFYASYDFGAVLWLPTYVHLRSLYLTFPFYLSMLCPMALLVHVVLYHFDAYRGREKNGVIAVSVIGGISVILCAVVAVIGFTETLFISAISPALPLERLATWPINAVFQPIATLLSGTYYLVYAIRAKRRADGK